MQFLMSARADDVAGSAAAVRDDTFRRHEGIDILFHWATAAFVLILIGTGLLMRMGLQFSWRDFHWISGVGITLLVAFHLLRSLFWKKLRTIWFTMAELRQRQVGKYSVMQKCMHHALAFVVLMTIVTGLLMLKRIQTPLLARDPSMFSQGTWDLVYALHDVATVLAATLVVIHVYFALIPENWMYLRAMITGRMSRADQRARVAALLKDGRRT